MSGRVLFFIIYRQHKAEDMPGKGNEVWKPIYKSEIKSQAADRNKLKFIFNSFSLLLADLCNEDEEKDVKLELF